MILDESEAHDNQFLLEGGKWSRERWWHRLIQVCRRWRYLVLQSASYLRLSLVCGRGTPVANMLAHFPPLPLIIDHFDDEYQDLTTEDEEGIILALQHRDRVFRIRLRKSIPILQKLIIALDGDFPVLEFLLLDNQRYHTPVIDHMPNFNLPDTFRAPHLRHLMLDNFATPIDSPPLTTMVNLVALLLTRIPYSAYFHPNVLLQRLFLMPQLEMLEIGFNLSRDVERVLLRTPTMTRVTLPNLRWLAFRGSNAYLEALLPWVTIPFLEKLQVCFFNQMLYSIPYLQQFISAAQNLRLKIVSFAFSQNCLAVTAFPHMGARLYSLYMELGGRRLDWQVVSAAQVFYAPWTVFSAVEHISLEYNRDNMSSEWNIEADRTRWRELLGSFGNVKTLFVDGGLVGQLSRALQPGKGDSPMELLPELQELSYSALGASHDAFTLFVDARQKTGRPVTIIQY